MLNPGRFFSVVVPFGAIWRTITVICVQIWLLLIYRYICWQRICWKVFLTRKLSCGDSINLCVIFSEYVCPGQVSSLTFEREASVLILMTVDLPGLLTVSSSTCFWLQSIASEVYSSYGFKILTVLLTANHCSMQYVQWHPCWKSASVWMGNVYFNL